jgi:hypothetical protein
MKTKKEKKYQELGQEDRSFVGSKLIWAWVALFSLSLATLVTTSYAWFNISNDLMVKNISLTFKNSDYFQMGLKKKDSDSDEITYFDTLDKATLEDYSSYSPDLLMIPVSSCFQSNWLNSNTVFADTTPEFRSNPGTETVATEGFYQFEFYFLSSRDAYVYLDEGTSLVPNEANNERTASEYDLNVDDLNKIKDCVRVSFYGEDFGYQILELNADQPSNCRFGGRLDVNPYDSYYDYDSHLKEILFGEYNDASKIVYSEDARVKELDREHSTFNAMSDDKAIPVDIDKSIENGLVFQHESTKILSEFEHDDNSNQLMNPILYCPMGVPTRCVISIYIEAWDPEAILSIGRSSFDLNLVFKAFYMEK